MPETDLKRHPIRGGIWGIPTGLGLGLLAINSQVFSLSITTLAVFTVAGIAIGTLWASFGPAKKPKGAPPGDTPEPEPQPITVPADEVPDVSAPAPPPADTGDQPPPV